MENAPKPMSVKELVINHLMFAAAAVVYITLMLKFEIYCPMRHLTGIPCACCGMSRAAVSLLHLNWEGYVHNNPAMLPFVAALFITIHKDTRMLSSLNKRLADVIIYAGFGFTAATYIIRIIFFEIP